MEEEFFEKTKPEYSTGRKVWLEFKDILAGVAFPFIITLVLSSTIIAFASYKADMAISIIALVGGEAMYIAAMVIFGRANGSAAYKKLILHNQKRELNSKEETVLYRTGEYAIWKAVVIPLIVCIPFVIFQTIELCYDNNACNFCLQYICAWAYYPFSYLGKDFQALNYICIIIPVAAHVAGYLLGKRKQIKIQEQMAAAAQKKGRRK
ncbi:MAG: hypothetical protein K2O67_01260 [Clostridia bacterium]|nr:hypothetical protein [Clostridia bacterium]